MPSSPDEDEPEKVAEAVRQMGLQYVVLTSVTRDDLADGGASHYAKAIRLIREVNPRTKIEVLIPDFRGQDSSLIHPGASSDVLNHNMKRFALYPEVRPRPTTEVLICCSSQKAPSHHEIRVHAGAGRRNRRSFTSSRI
jgi:lipoic acid synthetase